MTILLLLWTAPCMGCVQVSNLVPKAEIESTELTELSGVAPAGPQQYWGVNDSGHPPVLFRFDEAGKIVERVPLDATRNIDWEAMTRDSASNLYIADVGDNNRRRETYTIYRLTGEGPPKVGEIITFRYEDGASRNCESLFAFEGGLYLISKQNIGEKAEVFSLDIAPPADGAERRARRVGVMEIASPVTDATYSAERKEVAVLTYLGAILFHFEKAEDLTRPATGQVPGFFGIAEALSYTSDGQLLITNEPGSLWKATLPTPSQPADKPAAPPSSTEMSKQQDH